MKGKAGAMVLASLMADSFALGPHWIYDTSMIESKFGRVQHLLKPDRNSYHGTKDVGEFTHYGDQTLVLLESIAACSGFDLDHFASNWRALFATYDGYFDKATKGTLEKFSDGYAPTNSGSASSDLAGAARIAPLVYRYRDSREELAIHARAQTAMTHNNPMVVASADFFARVTYGVLHGNDPSSAMTQTMEESYAGTPFAAWVTKGFESVGADSRKVIAEFGQSCDILGAFPSVVHLVARYEGDLREALIENVMAGGDSAARGMLVGMILGAHLGDGAIPGEWLSGLKQYRHILDLLDKIDEG